MLHCFGNFSINNQKGRSGNIASTNILKQTTTQNSTGKQRVPQKSSFTGEASIVECNIKENQDEINFVYPRLLQYLICFL